MSRISPNDVLVPLAQLRAHDVTIRNIVTGSSDAEMYYRLFADHHARAAGLGELDPVTEFYNAYYWFQQVVRLHTAQHGYDAGVEQQAFQLLETAPDGVDFELVAELEELGRADPA